MLPTLRHLILCNLLLPLIVTPVKAETVNPGADEHSPSRSEYFSWINNTNEGTTEKQTLTNLAFFAWLKEEYGMQLDIYAFDAGAIDGKRWYGNMQSQKFRSQFPRGFSPIYQRSEALDIRLGIWGGPDGFGATDASAKARADMMVSLCKEFDFALFKFDSVAGQLRDNKQGEFAEMMHRCRQSSPDLILLNHRLNLGEIGKPHATTFLWEGKETYIDVHLWNNVPAPHNRAGALARGLPPNLSRLTEDHGVCLSSSLDYWDDELVLQAFNRALILSPQIYCNPWLLRDDEFPKLARIFNLAKTYRHLLTKGIVLPAERYGQHAVSRGDAENRIITLRNLSWEPKTFSLLLNEELGLQNVNREIPFRVTRFHPRERVLGNYAFGDEVEVIVQPFRSALFKVGTEQQWGLSGINYEVIKDVPGQPVILSLTGAAGEQSDISLQGSHRFIDAHIDGESAGGLISDQALTVQFEGKKWAQPLNRRLGMLTPIPLPVDAQALYESTVYAADNNALEVRSVMRSGETQHVAVKAARDAFFNQPVFVERGLWDTNLFDGDRQTAFYKMRRWEYDWNPSPDPAVANGAFRLDLGGVQPIDSFVLYSEKGIHLQPLKQAEGVFAEVSNDLLNWTQVSFLAGKTMHIEMPESDFPVRYLRIAEAPNWLSEIVGLRDGKEVNREKWRASNLFGDFSTMRFTHAWSNTFTLDEIAQDAYLSVAVPGEYGNEGVYAALKVDGKIIGAPDRSPAYPANTWELQVVAVNGNYTYYIPLSREWAGKSIEVVLLGRGEYLKDHSHGIQPQVWLNRKPIPMATKTLVLSRGVE